MSTSIKYPRTFHLPWSLGRSSDDKVLTDTECLSGKTLMATVKMDGENTTMTRDAVHARSLDSVTHESRTWVKVLWSQIRFDIPEGWRICGENLYAKHSIGYNNLGSYFHVFNIWNADNVCLNWTETVEWCELLGLTHVRVLHYGFTIEDIQNIHEDFMKNESVDQEGYVIRNIDSFPYSEFKLNVAKYVRANHVQTDSHWMSQKIVKNIL